MKETKCCKKCEVSEIQSGKLDGLEYSPLSEPICSNPTCVCHREPTVKHIEGCEHENLSVTRDGYFGCKCGAWGKLEEPDYKEKIDQAPADKIVDWVYEESEGVMTLDTTELLKILKEYGDIKFQEGYINTGDVRYEEGKIIGFKEGQERVTSKLAEWVMGYVGASSKAIFAHMTGAYNSGFYSAPYDNEDRERCVILLRAMPEWVERLNEMTRYAGWEEQIPLILSTLTPNENGLK